MASPKAGTTAKPVNVLFVCLGNICTFYPKLL